MSDDAVRRALANLAATERSDEETDEQSRSKRRETTFCETIARATTAMEDLDAAAQFVEDVGLDELEGAVARADRSVSACADDGERALAAFREFRETAQGGRASEAMAGSIDDRRECNCDHFHPGHGTSLGGGDIAPGE